MALLDIFLSSSSSIVSTSPPLLRRFILEVVASPDTPSVCSIRRSMASRTPAFRDDMLRISDSNCARNIPREDEVVSSFAINLTSLLPILCTRCVRSAGFEKVARKVDISLHILAKFIPSSDDDDDDPSPVAGFDKSRSTYHSSQGMALLSTSS